VCGGDDAEKSDLEDNDFNSDEDLAKTWMEREMGDGEEFMLEEKN
jgi:hypothetical protein